MCWRDDKLSKTFSLFQNCLFYSVQKNSHKMDFRSLHQWQNHNHFLPTFQTRPRPFHFTERGKLPRQHLGSQVVRGHPHPVGNLLRISQVRLNIRKGDIQSIMIKTFGNLNNANIKRIWVYLAPSI